MATNSSDDDPKIFRLALYGVRSSGKTCILSALSLPRVPHPDGLTCSWIENVPGHPLPSGDPDAWSTDDPYHIGWKWLDEQRNRLRKGELPPPNPNREDAMRFLFAFGAPNQGIRQVELLDYSGELITVSASELADQLRNHMRRCDGLLVLAEVPSPGHEHAPLAEDLEKLKGAFLSLSQERDSGPQPDWPTALLFTKWDRRTDPNEDGDTSPAELVDGFLNQVPLPPHASLVQALRNAVGDENVRSFPVSAFGAHQIRSDGSEAPLLDGALFRSRRLEDGFVWVMERCNELRVEKLERAATGASWFAFWQTPLGRLDDTDDDHYSSGRRWGRGVSPWAAMSMGWKLRRQFPRNSDPRIRIAHALRTLSLKLASHTGVFLLVLILGITSLRATLDGVQLRMVRATAENPSATAAQLQTAETWLEKYYKETGYFRWLSHAVVLSRGEASKILVNLRTSRDEELWKVVSEAPDPQTRVTLAQEYLKVFPEQGLFSHEAKTYLAEAERQESLTRKRDYLKDLALKINAVEVKPTTEIEDLQRLLSDVSSFSDIGDLPRPEATSPELENQQMELRAQIHDKQTQVLELKRQQDWNTFSQAYNSLMRNKDIGAAARVLVERTPRDPELQSLKEDFAKRAPSIIEKKVQDELKSRSWKPARDASALADDQNVGKLLPVSDMKELRKLSMKVDEAEDRDLYSQIVRYRPQCADQISAYLTRAPLKIMRGEAERYQQWLKRMREPLDLTLTLTEIQWHNDYWARRVNYYNDVAVQLRGKPVIENTGILSTRNTRSRNIGNGKIRARLDETVTIDVTVIAKYGWFVTSTMPGGSGKWTGTPDQLRSGVTIDLNGDGFTNRATFSVTGVPPEPKLSEWTRR